MRWYLECLLLLAAVAAYCTLIYLGGWGRAGMLLISPVLLSLFYELTGNLWRTRPRHAKRLCSASRSYTLALQAQTEEARIESMFDSRAEYVATMYPKKAVER